MNDARLQALYARAVAARTPSSRDGCLAPEDLIALAERTLPPAERERVVEHVTVCSACRREYDLLYDVAASARSRPGSARPWLAAAAAIALVLGGGLIWHGRRGDQRSPLRGKDAVLTLLEPATAAVPAGPRFVWRPVPGASRYEYELLAPAGERAYAASTTDTLLVLPDRLRLTPGATYRWWVRAALPGGAQVESNLRPVRILGP